MRLPTSKSARIKAAATLAAALLAAASFHAEDSPLWWLQRGALSAASPADDYAAINQGQARNIAKQAYEEFKARGVVNPATQSTSALVLAWESPAASTDDYAAINVGQLKALAKPFYERLVAAGELSALPTWATTSNSAVDNYLLANVGQVKSLFTFASLPPAWWVQTGATTSLSLPSNQEAPVTMSQLYGFALDGYSALQSALSAAGGAGTAIGTQTTSWQAATEIQAGLRGEYFNNATLSGSPVLVRYEAVDFNWGGDTADWSMYNGNFGVRWTGEILTTVAGDYVFGTDSDTGIKLWIDDELEIDQSDGGNTVGSYQPTTTVWLPANTWVRVKLEYYHHTTGSDTHVRFFWQTPVPGSGSGATPAGTLRGVYFSDKELTTHDYEANETVDFHREEQYSLFSARWTGSFVSEEDEFNLYTQSDNGMRIWVDGALLSNNYNSWTGGTLSQSDPFSLSAGPHAIVIEYNHYDTSGGVAYAHWALWPSASEFESDWENDSFTGNGAVSDLMTPAQSYGLRGEYFSGTGVNGTSLWVTHGAVNFDWGYGSPATAVPTDYFSARWTGWLLPEATGQHTFETYSDTGVKLWINGELIIDNWSAHTATLDQGTAWLEEGVPVSVRLEYYENSGPARLSLGWATGSDPTVPIPMSRLTNSDSSATTVPLQNLRWNPANETATLRDLRAVAGLFRSRLTALGYTGFPADVSGYDWAAASVADLKDMFGFDLVSNAGLDADGDGLSALLETLFGTNPNAVTTTVSPAAMGLVIHTPLE